MFGVFSCDNSGYIFVKMKHSFEGKVWHAYAISIVLSKYIFAFLVTAKVS